MAKFHPRKRFGQNFLVNKGVIEKIIGIVEPAEGRQIVEVGPGKGALTEHLVKLHSQVHAIEIDRDLAGELHQQFGEMPNFHLYEVDFLEFDLETILPPQDEKIVVVGNIPYNITTPIITRLFQFYQKIEFALLMVQWEVAKRIVATPKDGKDYGSLSLAISYYTQPEICFKVKRGSFFPVPNVDSAIVKLNFRPRPAVTVADEKLLFKVIHQAFQFRRKTLRNCLRRPPFDLSVEQVDALSRTTNINMDTRGEKLSLEEFALLANEIFSLQKDCK